MAHHGDCGVNRSRSGFHFAFHVLKWLGIACLCWLAFKMWRQLADNEAESLPKRSSAMSMFGAGMALTLGNPKIMVFFIALLPSLIDVSAVGYQQWAILALVTLLGLALIDLTWTFLADRARLVLKAPRARHIANRIGAVSLGGVAGAINIRN